MCVNLDPCGPLGPVPPNSRLSSLLWQSVHRMRTPIARPWVTPSIFSMLESRLGWDSGLLLSCVTGWLEDAVSASWGMMFSGSSCSLAPRSNCVGPTPLWGAWQEIQAFCATVWYEPSGAAGGAITRSRKIGPMACALVVQFVSGLVCPVITRLGS